VRDAPQRFGLLLVAAYVQLPHEGEASRGRLERLIRTQVERAYAQQGARDVDYQLEIL